MRSYGLDFLVYGHEFLLSYVGTEATQKGRFDSGWAYFSSNFLYREARGAKLDRGEDTEMLGPPPSGSQRTGRADQRDARGESRPNYPKSPSSGASLRHAATEKHKQRNNDHDETPRAARPPPDPSDGRPRGLGASLIERR